MPRKLLRSKNQLQTVVRHAEKGQPRLNGGAERAVRTLRDLFRGSFPNGVYSTWQAPDIRPSRKRPRPAKDLKSKTLRAGMWLQQNDPEICLQFCSRLHFKRASFAGLRKNKKEKKGPPKKGSPKKGKRGVLWQSLTSLEMQPGAKLRRVSRGRFVAAAF